MKALIAFVGVLGLLALFAILNGFTLTVLWGWFITPTFGLPALTLAPAIGVALVVRFLTYQDKPDSKAADRSKEMRERIVRMVLKPAVALAIGWIVKQWM